MVTHHPITVWRFWAGHTQEAAGALFGISKSYLSEIENWKKAPNVAVARKIAKETGLSLDQILMEKPDGKSPKE